MPEGVAREERSRGAEKDSSTTSRKEGEADSFAACTGICEVVGAGHGASQDVTIGGAKMADVHVYVDRPSEKEGTALGDLAEALKKLDHVSDVDVNAPGNVVAVSFEGGRVEQEMIERTVEETGYGISRVSVRTTFPED
jgi:copper chaperone CopZ